MPSPNPERRSERARKAILAAALELSQDPGFQATSIEAIAKRAGVGKQTIYRWWPSKGAVVLEALHEMAGTTLTFPDTGDIVADLKTQMTEVARFMAGAAGGPLADLIGASQSDPALAKAMIETVYQPRIAACLERLEAAQRQGQLRADADIEEVMELLYGPLYYRLLLRTRAITDHQPGEILRLAFKGLTPEAPAPEAPARQAPARQAPAYEPPGLEGMAEAPAPAKPAQEQPPAS